MFNSSKCRISMAAILLALAGTSATARADINVCNCSGDDVVFEMTKSSSSCSPQPWASSGWWFIPHKSCLTVWSGDSRNQEIWWTAANASTTWGDASASWLVPNNYHDDLCLDWVSTFCTNSDASCRWSPHFDVASSAHDIEIDVDPNNTFDTNRKYDCEHSSPDDCVAWECH